jgi:Uncharacterized protein conserved in bacteria (DUF2188)
MASRKTYTVSKIKSGGWEAKESGGGIVASGEKKAEVVRAAVKIARQQDAASLKIKRATGQIQEERTYPRRSDPRRSKG